MLTTRIIPCLDIKHGRTVKGTNFIDLRDAGDPVELAARYYNEGADELVLLDIGATIEGRKTFVDIVERVARAVVIPFTVGGGISEVDDIRRLLDAGADKVSLNSAIVRNPSLLEEAADRIGSQSLVAAIDARRREGEGQGWGVWTDGGSRPTTIDAIEWACEAVERGAGELLVTSMDRDGTKEGYDIELLATIADRVNVPIIASGGAGRLEHLRDAIVLGKCDGLLAASIFHYEEITLGDLKRYLHECGIPVRL
jgi:cyclase